MTLISKTPLDLEVSDPAFLGAKKLIGEQEFEWITQQIVMVVGLGGVGSWVVEALARTGFQKLVLIDLDEICVSNTNRQIHTLRSTVGKSKAQALSQRILDIHPGCEVEVVEDFLQKENIKEYLQKYKPSVVVDAIDSLGVKCELAAEAKKQDTTLLVAGSAGGRLKASMLRIDDLALTYEDDLLHQMRKRLRQKHGFPRGKKKFKIRTVFSTEPKKNCEPDTGRLDCQTGLGSLCHVTASMGLLLVEEVVTHLKQMHIQAQQDLL